MKKIILLLIFCVSVSIAQENKVETNEENEIDYEQEDEEVEIKNHFVNLLFSTPYNLGLAYEYMRINMTSLRFELTMGSKYGIVIYDASKSDISTFMSFSYNFSFEYRFYFNSDNTSEENNNPFSNLEKFLALKTSASIPLFIDDSPIFEDIQYTMAEISMIAGIRIISSERFNWELGGGIGIGVYRNSSIDSSGLYIPTPLYLILGFIL